MVCESSFAFTLSTPNSFTRHSQHCSGVHSGIRYSVTLDRIVVSRFPEFSHRKINLFHASGYAGGLTPLLNRDGTPVITPISTNYEE